MHKSQFAKINNRHHYLISTNKLEKQFPTGHFILDNIPSFWLSRRSHEMKLTTWFDVPTSSKEEFDSMVEIICRDTYEEQLDNWMRLSEWMMKYDNKWEWRYKIKNLF